MKKCSVCGVDKEESEFHFHGFRLSSACKPCERAQKRPLYVKYRKRLKEQVFKKLGGKCVCCGVDTMEFLSLHHTRGNGQIDRGSSLYSLLRRIRDGNYDEKDYDIMCFNCNLSLGFFGYCPHRR